MDPQRIAIVAQPFDGVLPPLQNSIGIWVHEVAKRFASSRETVVYLPRSEAAPEPRTIGGVAYVPLPLHRDQRLQRLLARFENADDPRRPPYVGRLHWALYALKAALDARRRGVELVHIINFPQFLPIFRYAAPKARRVLNMRCEWLSQLDRGLMARYLKHADAVIGCSRHVTGLVADRFTELADRCHTVPNAIDTERFAPADGADAGTAGPRLLYVGRVSPEKGVHVLIEAMRAVVDARPDATLEIVGGHRRLPRAYLLDVSDDPAVRTLERFYEGDGNDVYVKHLQQRIGALGLDDHVTLWGGVPQADILERLRGADLLVNPSFSESFGRGPVEAMACGLPVVAARVGGMLDTVVDGETGRLVDVDDAGDLAARIVEVLDDPSRMRAMGLAGVARARRLFSWDAVVGDLERIYAGGGPS